MKNRIHKTGKRNFTLIELLVSMGILVVILGFILQFFVGSQKIWTSMEQRNNIYADARVAMDIMTTLLQNACNDGSIPFYMDDETSGENKIYFATRSKLNLPGGPLKYVSFQRGGTGSEDTLKLSVFCDKDNNFGNYFPPYGLGTITDLGTARKDLVEDKLELTKSPHTSDLIQRVVAFDMIPYKRKNSVPAIEKIDFPSPPPDPSATIEIPFLIEIRLSMLSPNDYKIWEKEWKSKSPSDSGRIAFLKEHAYVFSRTVFLGEQSRLNIN